jgi:hypothetical protein
MSTNRKNTNVWGIPSMETYLTSIMIWKKGTLFCISTATLITNIPLTSWGNEMKFTEKIEKELI